MKKFTTLFATALLMVVFITTASAASFTPNADAAYTQYGWVTTPATADENYHITVGITLAGEAQETVFTSAVAFADYNEASYVYESEALVDVLTINTFAEVIFNDKNEVIDFERIERPIYDDDGKGDFYYLDSMKYGGELTNAGGGPGSMIAQGWIMATGDKTITVGDGNHLVNTFEETYKLADDCAIFLVNNPGKDEAGNLIQGNWAAEPASASDIKICPRNEDGEVYNIPTRWTALCIFNESAVDPETRLTKADVSGAEVTELYLYKNPTGIESAIAPDDVGYNGTSWMPGQDKTTGKTSYGWNGANTPFEVLTDRLFSVGDSFTNIFLFVSDADETGDKTLTLLDMGNATASYGYWLNMEKMGYDPRAVDNVLLTHGHGDHYQALYECNTMVNRAAGADKLQVYTSGADQAGYLNGVYTGITLTAKTERYVVDSFNEWNVWVDFGKGVSVYPVPTPGHANDVASFIFKLTTHPEDKYFSRYTKEPVETAWVYMGGYGGGASTKVGNGYTKLQYKYSMQYLQSVIVPYAESIADHVYNIPQHADQAPWYEISKAVRTKQAQGEDILFLDVWNEGRESIINLLEKRLSAYSYQWMNSAWKATESTSADVCYDLYDQNIVPFIRGAGFNWYCTPQNKNTESTEVYGPWKRDAGSYKIKVDSVLVLHGFDAFQNKSEALAGMTNIYGWDISKGMSVDKDSYAHDPNGWYVQLVADVDDDYIGGMYFSQEDAAEIAKLDNKEQAYPVNWYVAKGNSYVGFDSAQAAPKSGPIESMAGEGWTEIIRTQRLNTKEEAEALAAYISKCMNDGSSTFEVKLNIGGDIVLPEGYISAANAPLDDQFLTSLNDDAIKATFPGTGYYSLEEEPLVIEKCKELNAAIDLTTMLLPTK